MTSKQMEAFKRRTKETLESTALPTGRHAMGMGRAALRLRSGCLMARRLVEAGVPFVEVDLGGWDMHANIFTTLEGQSARYRSGNRRLDLRSR